jgi:hypothetical protein
MPVDVFVMGVYFCVQQRRITWTSLEASIWEIRNSCKISVTKSERKSPLERLSFRWDYNIKIDLKEI